MNFATSFSNSFSAVPHLSSSADSETLYDTLYEINPLTEENLITLYARGTIEAGYPFFYQFHSLHCFCLLYTISGNGKVVFTENENSFLLSPATFLFFDCSRPFSLETTAAPWKFKILFAGGGNLPFYLSSTGLENGLMLKDIFSGELLYHFNFFFQSCVDSNIQYKFQDEKNMTNLLVSFLSCYFERQSLVQKVPDYLLEMKQLFDTHYEQKFTLEDLEYRLGISKYRLCREFSSHFAESPIQYLNRVRIFNAKLLLRSTNMKIHEIGAQVGIENTNHFITLFKRFEGITPLLYRETGLLP